MSESLVSEWLDENRHRAFPLKEDVQRVAGSYTLDDGVLLDAYFHIESDTPVQLVSLVVSPSDVTVTTNVDVFVIDKPVPEDGVCVTVDSGSKITVGVVVNDIPDGTYDFDDVFFEDSLAVYYNAPWLGVNSIQFGDLSPVDGVVDVFPRVYTYLNTDGVDSLIWRVGKNQGTPADNCQVYGDLPDDCGEQVSFINGVTSNNTSKQFKLTSGNGIRVESDTDNNQIVISLGFDVGNICPPIPPTT